MSERRGLTRQKSFLRGCIYFNNRRSATDCLIRDISETGARLIFSDTVNVPDLVDIHIPQKDQTLRARVEWRNGDEVGISFLQGISLDGHGELGQRVERLEAEVASLRRMIKRLKVAIAGKTEEAV